jgi:LysR family hydrogen peroxide-inducible transcriptional activator
MDITLRQLEYFIALAEARGFGAAAEKVFVTQPALSVQIRELEARIGAQLVIRDRRGISLTPAGQEVLRSAYRMRAELIAMQSAVRWQEGLTGRLKLGVIPTVAPYLLPKALPLIAARYPGVDLRVREAMTHELLAALDDGALDAAVLALPSGRADQIERPLFEDRFLLAGAHEALGGLVARADSLRPATLDPDSLLLLDEGHCLADQALEVCGLARSSTRVDLGAASLATLCGLVAGGFGFTFLPEIALASERAAAPGMGVARFSAPEPRRMIGLVRRNLPGPDAWFAALAGLLEEAGRVLLSAQPHVPGA